jgi:hypothetical protein
MGAARPRADDPVFVEDVRCRAELGLSVPRAARPRFNPSGIIFTAENTTQRSRNQAKISHEDTKSRRNQKMGHFRHPHRCFISSRRPSSFVASCLRVRGLKIVVVVESRTKAWPHPATGGFLGWLHRSRRRICFCNKRVYSTCITHTGGALHGESQVGLPI